MDQDDISLEHGRNTNILRQSSENNHNINSNSQHHNYDDHGEIAITIHTDPYHAFIPALRAHLPHSIPLLRRIQHAIAYPSPTASFLATSLPDVSSCSSSSSPWLAAFVDLYAGSETQVWVYSSLEAEASLPSSGEAEEEGGYLIANFSGISSEKKDRARAQLLVLLSFIKTNLLPGYLSFVESNKKEDSRAATAGPTPSSHASLAASSTSPSPPKIPPPPPQAFLLGSLHTGLFTLLTASESYTDAIPLPGLRIHRHDVPPYIKYLFHPSTYKSYDNDEHALPPKYRYHDRTGRHGVLPHHLDLVINRTHIPRSRNTLMKMPSVAVYYDRDDNDSNSIVQDGTTPSEEMPIAWGFISVDGSLATLHVEPEHRGQGLAVTLSKEIMRRAMAVDNNQAGGGGEGGIFRFPREVHFSSDDNNDNDHDAWTHADVATTNVASRRVMEKIGGRIAWTDTWTVVELCDNT
ncbi:hypothetical protein VTN77DRAFT_8409 [Rasamsonia byssochlamydoides]|uniref:uncharacterized protein n=1 Tax=Rasamsonia byssochlamydoides TaxID=89139 RepID=UPI003743953B